MESSHNIKTHPWLQESGEFPSTEAVPFDKKWKMTFSCKMKMRFCPCSALPASLLAQTLKNLPAVQETWVRPLGGEGIPWRRKWQPTPVFLPGEFHEQRSLVGYSPRGRKELDTIEQLTFSAWLFGPNPGARAAAGVLPPRTNPEGLVCPRCKDGMLGR